MEILFVIVPIFIAFVFVMVVAGSILQFFAIGSIFSLMRKKMHEHQETVAPRPCAYCGAMIPLGEPQCPSCGAARELSAGN